MVAPTPAGVSIDAPEGIVAPVTALAPLTLIALPSLVDRIPITGACGDDAEPEVRLVSANPVAT
jgi:hypothetical protein